MQEATSVGHLVDGYEIEEMRQGKSVGVLSSS